MLSGIIVWGGAGLALDRWLGTKFFALIGVLLGLGVAIYLIIVKYAPPVPPPGKAAQRTSRGGRPSQPRTQKGQR
jgi:F0F1-type ATP synthase assembly protein I